MFCIKENGQIIAFGGFTIMKRNPEIRIEHLCVDSDHRNKHCGISIMKKIIEETSSKDLPIVITCRDGADNNTFYEKFKKEEYTIIHKQTLDVRRYVLDKNKIINY